jgi:hypothetical protein
VLIVLGAYMKRELARDESFSFSADLPQPKSHFESVLRKRHLNELEHPIPHHPGVIKDVTGHPAPPRKSLILSLHYDTSASGPLYVFKTWQ